MGLYPTFQWPFQERKLEVPTIYKAYVRGYTPKIWLYMVQYLLFGILEFPLNFPRLKLKLWSTTFGYGFSMFDCHTWLLGGFPWLG